MKPMLAASVKLEQVQYPVLVSAKLDGIRCVGTDNGPRTRTLKPIQNIYTRNMLSDKLFSGFDGELIVGDYTATDVFAKTTSGIMSAEGRPEFMWLLFDMWDEPDSDYIDRYQRLIEREQANPWSNTVVIPQDYVEDEAGLIAAEHRYLEQGYEGVILRSPESKYKYGRSTVREHYLLKRKPLADAEGVIANFMYLERNLNEMTRDAVGNAKRSNQQANQLVDYDRVGSIEVTITTGPFAGARVSIGTGFTDQQRLDLVDMHDDHALIGSTVTFTYQASGSKDAPRFPSFKGFRKD